MRIDILTNTLSDKSKVFDVVIRSDTGETLQLPARNEAAARALQAGIAGLIEVHTNEVVEEHF